MNREIKFRGLSVETGEWVYGLFYIGHGTGNTCISHSDEWQPSYKNPDQGESTVLTSVKYDSIGQFTGLKDKNGVEIYEGDIIQFAFWWFDGNVAESTLTGTIVYSDDLMSFQLKGIKNKEWESHTGHVGDNHYLTPFSELDFDESNFSVIGNIHLNPELLEQSK